MREPVRELVRGRAARVPSLRGRGGSRLYGAGAGRGLFDGVGEPGVGEEGLGVRGEVLAVEDGPGEDAGDVGEVGVRGEADLADGAALFDVQDGDVLVGGAEGAFQAQPSLAAPQVVAAAVGVFDAVGELGGGPAGGGQQGAAGGRRPCAVAGLTWAPATRRCGPRKSWAARSG